MSAVCHPLEFVSLHEEERRPVDIDFLAPRHEQIDAVLFTLAHDRTKRCDSRVAPSSTWQHAYHEGHLSLLYGG